MAETTPAQVARLVHLVAWMSQRDTGKAVPYRAAAKQLGVSEKALRQDLDTLVRLTDEYKPWLSSLNIAFTADGFMLASQGPFRRPFRLTGDETLALILGLATVGGGQKVATKLGTVLAKNRAVERATPVIGLGPTPSEHVEEVLGLIREAIGTHRKLEINYCGSEGEPGRRVVHPHQIVQRQVWWYVIAWCERVEGFRHFRADRVLEARILGAAFTLRSDFKPLASADEVFRADDTITATVAFSRRIARWMKEKYPKGREQSDGRYVVEFRVADPGWFVREILQYGAEAEVVEPARLREAVANTIAGRS
jgi:predicted DNA-binding transcriptional regulator YafY